MSNRHSFTRNGWVVSDMTLVFSVRQSFGRPLVISCFARLTDFEVGLLIGPHWTASIINNLLATWKKKEKGREPERIVRMFTNHLAIRPREGHQIDLFQYSGQVSDVDYTFFPPSKRIPDGAQIASRHSRSI